MQASHGAHGDTENWINGWPSFNAPLRQHNVFVVFNASLTPTDAQDANPQSFFGVFVA